MIRRIVLYFALIVFFFGGFYVMSMIPSAVDEKEAKISEMVNGTPLTRVSVMTVEPRPLVETITMPGTVEAYEDITLGAVIPGVVEKIHVQEGDRVTKGQELFQIDLRSRLAMQAEALATFDLAQKTLERRKKLRERGDVTIQEYDEAVSAAEQAAAAKRRWEVEVSLGKIAAPIDGFIDRVDVDEGEYMHEGAELARLLKLDQVKITVGIPELHVDSVSKRKQAQIYIDGLQEERNAVIERVAYAADTLTNTFEATLRVDNPDYRIRPGMIVRATLITKEIPDAMMAPLFSLVKRESGMVLFVEKEGEVEARHVVMGAIDKNSVEILQGLLPGENIIVVGQKDLVHGQKVEVVERVPQSTAAEWKKEIE